jgi:hypothetical protein
MLRVLLQVSLLLGFVPAPPVAAHCAAHGAVTTGEPSHDHHEPRDGEHAECSHCPPHECAAQVSCATAPMLAGVTESAPAWLARTAGWVPAPVSAIWTSRVDRPPLRPPVPFLT